MLLVWETRFHTHTIQEVKSQFCVFQCCDDINNSNIILRHQNFIWLCQLEYRKTIRRYVPHYLFLLAFSYRSPSLPCSFILSSYPVIQPLCCACKHCLASRQNHFAQFEVNCAIEFIVDFAPPLMSSSI
jgi:hypothetical protein